MREKINPSTPKGDIQAKVNVWQDGYSSRINWDFCRISMESYIASWKVCVCVHAPHHHHHHRHHHRVVIVILCGTHYGTSAWAMLLYVCIVYIGLGLFLCTSLIDVCLSISWVQYYDSILCSHSLSLTTVLHVWFRFLYRVLLPFFSCPFFDIYFIFWQRTNPIFNIAERVYMIDFVFCLDVFFSLSVIRCVVSFVLFVFVAAAAARIEVLRVCIVVFFSVPRSLSLSLCVP